MSGFFGVDVQDTDAEIPGVQRAEEPSVVLSFVFVGQEPGRGDPGLVEIEA